MKQQPSDPQQSLRVAVLGPVAVRQPGDGFVEPGGHRAKALIVALALAAPRALGSDRLIEETWADEPPRGARAALQTLVSRIRSALGDDLIESTPSGYRLGDTATLDLREAERLLDEARVDLTDERWPDAATNAATALALWRGAPGADLDGDTLASALIDRAARVLDGLETVLATASLALDLAVEAEALARRLCLRSPFDDSAHLLLMRALDALGRSTEAVGVYATFRERVQDAFGTSPALELQSLNLELLAREAESGPAGDGRWTAHGEVSSTGGRGEGVPRGRGEALPGGRGEAGRNAGDDSGAATAGAAARGGCLGSGLDAEERVATGVDVGRLEVDHGPRSADAASGGPVDMTTDDATRTRATPTPDAGSARGNDGGQEPLLGSRGAPSTDAVTRHETLASDGRAAAPPAREGAPAPARPGAGAPRRAAVARGIRAAPNALIGRDGAVAEIERLMAGARVTTILGPGGLGKTRVAHEVAARALSWFGAVIVVELASVRSADDVIFGLASALGIREVASTKRIGDQVVRADLRTRVVARLAEAPTLLVLDNCEHVIDAAAEWSASLTAELPALTVLTTSRTPLAISSERVFALAPLGATDAATAPEALADDPAVRLFLDRATAARPGAQLPLDAVARLCARLDGLPLAIELAAARIRSMPLDEVERRLSNRFALLAGGDRSAPERHRTLLAVIEWSWNLLATDEQLALARLSEFADGFSADAAQAVTGGGSSPSGTGADPDVTDLLDALVAQSLVTLRETASGVRYRMLETVREFGQLQLDRAGTRMEVRDALFAWAVEFSARLQPQMDGRRQVATFAAIAVEEVNLIDVLRRAIDAERPDVVVSVFGLLGYYWTLRSAHSEVLAFSRPVFESIRRYDPTPAEVQHLAAVLLIISATTMIADLRFAVLPLSRLRRIVAAEGIDDDRLRAMASILLAAGDEQRVTAAIEAAASSPDRATAMVGALVGSVSAENDGRRDDAIRLARGAVRLADSIGDTWGGAMASQMLGSLHSQSAEPEEALRWARRARIGLTQIGAAEDIRQLEWTVATNDISVGELDEALEIFERLIESPGETDGVDIASIGLAGKAEVYRAHGRLDEARELHLRALTSFGAPGTRASPWYRMVLSAVLTTLVVDETGRDGEDVVIARRLRARTLASLRWMSGFVDRPVLGASVIGLAVWVEDRARASAGFPIPAGVGLELLALAHVLSARQDAPALHLDPLFARFGRSFTPDEIAGALDAAAAVTADERPGRVAELLRTPGPWSWAPRV
ncbi:AfsR/SARP family transcriptional regulator [Herbiconiux daphne]|uniref:OmpR/PhoB-type domain-containing protein n=1 Tax=Herbiconiux daphne TaxID=2970914 RepID=A0ABT2GYC9_9MICO|nr:BTAD domain-containing putative transcriptional regulator [Herbiconiux daphne]MCS5732966.1 hypothetical protein [Herbiconiux daphne]